MKRRPACEPASGVRPAAAKPGGFTLIELLTVMAIMVIVMTMAGVSYYKTRQSAEMRSAGSTIRTSLSLARQHAVVKRATTQVRCDNTVDTNGLNIGYIVIQTVQAVGIN